jgi:LacI family transcriptional regulator
MTEAGLEPLESFLAPEEEALGMLLPPDRRATGVICYCNYEATLLVHALWEHGVAVPADVSIVGFNDMFATQNMTPPLTTVGFDASRIGELGAAQVLKEIASTASKRQPLVRIIQPKLIVRGSTGPVRSCRAAGS